MAMCIAMVYICMNIYIAMVYICMAMNSMYVCMYVCIHVCMHACMYVCMYVCIHICMYAKCMYCFDVSLSNLCSIMYRYVCLLMVVHS